MVQMVISTILPDFTNITVASGDFRLRLVQKLGTGAYGVVYLAQDLARDPRGPPFYAVKCLLRHPDGSELERQQEREIANHRAVSDAPHVVTLHAVVKADFYVFLVLDLCAGGDLFDPIIERGTFAHNDAAIKRTYLQIIDALAACHAKGVYHRDLKPENILCSADDENVYLADFGLSTRSTRSTHFGCGSSFYMSPENMGIFHDKAPYLTAPSDVWSLGTILCNLVTGRNPWYLASPKTDEGFRLFLRDGPTWLSNNLPMSSGTADILGRIFEIDPTRRITLPELRAAIEALDTFFPGAAPSPSVVSSQPFVEGAHTVSFIQPVPSELRPLELDLPSAALSTQFLSFSADDIAAAAATATFVHHDTSTASHFSDALSDVWSFTAAPRCPPTPDAVSDAGGGSSSGEESPGPDTPQTFSMDVPEDSPVVPEFALDADSPAASPALEPAQVETSVVLTSVKAKDARCTKKRRGSLRRVVDGMKRIRILQV